MKKESGITLVALVVTIIILIILAGISLQVTIGENGIITRAKQAKQNITLAGEAEAMQLNQLYYELETGGEMSEDEESTKKDEIIALLQKQVDELQKQVASLQTENTELKKQIENLNIQISNLQTEIADLKAQIATKEVEIANLKKQVSEKEAKIQDLQNQLNNINSLLAQTNATADKILSGYKAYSGGKLLTGTMINQGAINSSLNCSQTYTIPAGYHNGSGKITANSLASQTSGTATSADILIGKTAWVNGNKITGTNKSKELETISVTFPVSTAWVTSKTVSIASIYSQYGNITINNIIPVFNNYPDIRNSQAVNAFAPSFTFSYSASNGNFTVNCNTEMRTYSTFSMKLYIVQ